MGDYHKLWILLREQLTKKENNAERYSVEHDDIHSILILMAEMEAAQFLED